MKIHAILPSAIRFFGVLAGCVEPIRSMPSYGSLMARNFQNHGGPEPDGVGIQQDENSQEVRARDVVIKLNQNKKMETRPCSV
jgi:hypothetical protein